MAGPKSPVPSGTIALSSKTPEDWMKGFCRSVPRREWYPNAVGDLGPNSTLSFSDFLQVIYKWAPGLGVAEVGNPPSFINFVANEPNPNFMKGIRRLFQIHVEVDVRAGIDKLKVNSFRKKFFLEHIPDKEFFARYTQFLP